MAPWRDIDGISDKVAERAVAGTGQEDRIETLIKRPVFVYPFLFFGHLCMKDEQKYLPGHFVSDPAWFFVDPLEKAIC